MRPNGRRNGMIRPLLGGCLLDAAELAFIILMRTAIRECVERVEIEWVLAFAGLMAGEVHRDGRISAVCPKLDPIAVGCATTPVKQHDDGEPSALRGRCA